MISFGTISLRQRNITRKNEQMYLSEEAFSGMKENFGNGKPTEEYTLPVIVPARPNWTDL